MGGFLLYLLQVDAKQRNDDDDDDDLSALSYTAARSTIEQDAAYGRILALGFHGAKPCLITAFDSEKECDEFLQLVHLLKNFRGSKSK